MKGDLLLPSKLNLLARSGIFRVAGVLRRHLLIVLHLINYSEQIGTVQLV